jgi:hypothetical protein
MFLKWYQVTKLATTEKRVMISGNRTREDYRLLKRIKSI